MSATTAKQFAANSPVAARALADIISAGHHSTMPELVTLDRARVESPEPKFQVVIVGSALGNSDFTPFQTLNQASAMFRRFITENNFGASQAGSCFIYSGGKIVARISYNGKVWAGAHYSPKAEPIYTP